MTRNRATQSQKYARTWYCNKLNAVYYGERATPGGLLISEATAISLEGSGMAGVPGIFTPEQKLGWKQVIDAIHRQGGSFVMQLWHAGRATHSTVTGMTPVSASAVPISDKKHTWPTLPTEDYEVPREMSVADMDRTTQDFVNAAKAAREVGADGVELHAANGYLLDQFLHSNINQRHDNYGGTSEKRCRFVLGVTAAVGSAVGHDRVGVRLSPYTIFQQTRGAERVPQWSYLCKQLSKLSLAYIHLVEPRYDEFRSEDAKLQQLVSLSNSDQLDADQMSLKPFHDALERTNCIVSGGYNLTNCWQGIEQGDYEAIAFGRYFTSNPDLVRRLENNLPLVAYDRSRFYGPFPDNENHDDLPAVK
ncbi:putative 12-oxophytodienoate reductase [Crepidotus variabilis]|uniref:12-oxophytodienoate reductase n=1 Tax=Crepidotus variabilis TaxID=179855 RepID=A0A9P6EDN7_9AGAR|nr:putative 12-oxophytodienoate reductase [Crepidotus variabilis]